MPNLILGRKQGQGITITSPDGTKVRITVVEHRTNYTRFAVEAPLSWTVNRDEIQQRIDSAKLPPSTFDVGEPLPEDAWNRSIEVHEQPTEH